MLPTILSQLDLQTSLYGDTDRYVSDLQITQSICVSVKGCARYLLTGGWDDCTRRSAKRGPQMRTPRSLC